MGEKEYKRNALPSSSFPSSYLSAPAALEKKKKEKLRRDPPALHPLGTQSARCTTTVITVKLSTRQGSVSLPAPLSLSLSLPFSQTLDSLVHLPSTEVVPLLRCSLLERRDLVVRRHADLAVPEAGVGVLLGETLASWRWRGW